MWCEEIKEVAQNLVELHLVQEQAKRKTGNTDYQIPNRYICWAVEFKMKP